MLAMQRTFEMNKNSKGYTKNPWPKTGNWAINPVGWKQHVASPIPTENPQRVRKRRVSAFRTFIHNPCVWFHVFILCAAVWFTRFYEYGYLVQFLPIQLAMRRNPFSWPILDACIYAPYLPLKSTWAVHGEKHDTNTFTKNTSIVNSHHVSLR